MEIRSRLAVCLAAIFLGLAMAMPAQADDPDFISFSAGAFDVFPGDDDEVAGEFRLEYRSDLKLWIFKPFVGVMATTDAAFYGYGGVLVDIYLGKRFVATPSFAVGYYEEGDGLDLGSAAEFRSQIEIAYRFDDRSRLGLSFSHMSNAGIGDDNPGSESLMLTYALPLNAILGD